MGSTGLVSLKIGIGGVEGRGVGLSYLGRLRFAAWGFWASLGVGVEPFTPHQLRHLYATEMLRNGAKLEVVGRILGHASIGITADVYRHVSWGEMREEVERYAPMNGVKG